MLFLSLDFRSLFYQGLIIACSIITHSCSVFIDCIYYNVMMSCFLILRNICIFLVLFLLFWRLLMDVFWHVVIMLTLGNMPWFNSVNSNSCYFAILHRFMLKETVLNDALYLFYFIIVVVPYYLLTTPSLLCCVLCFNYSKHGYVTDSTIYISPIHHGEYLLLNLNYEFW